jgi:sugar O-acyltransferase (sialic acid O-acetyltransferase NeuD family)
MLINNFKKQLICWGGSDQCIVLKPIIEALGSKIDVIIDDTPELLSPFKEIPILQGKLGLTTWLRGRKLSNIGFIIAIGNPYGLARCQLHEYLVDLGLTPVTICDKSSMVANDVVIGSGAQIMQGVIVNTKAKLGKQCILNNKSLIEHHDELGDGIEIAPGAILTGRVKVGNYSWICAGVTVIPRINIGSNVIIGAGAVVINDIIDDVVAVGVPAKVIKKNTIKGNI